MPEWVPRSRLIVSAAEDFLLWLFDATGSPDALGSRVALAWIGGLPDGRSPMIHQVVAPTHRRAVTEFLIAAPISKDEPHPGATWFREHDVPDDAVPTPDFWEAHASYESTRAYARGVCTALGWALGVIDDILHMTPAYWEDGSRLSDADRQACGDVLDALTRRPVPPPARPTLSRRRPERAATSWIA